MLFSKSIQTIVFHSHMLYLTYISSFQTIICSEIFGLLIFLVAIKVILAIPAHKNRIIASYLFPERNITLTFWPQSTCPHVEVNNHQGCWMICESNPSTTVVSTILAWQSVKVFIFITCCPWSHGLQPKKL